MGTHPAPRNRFGEKRFVPEAEGVYVAEGYDFSNIVFIVAPKFVVAIDAGTTEETARDAVTALRRITQAPIKYVILTHGHWDHVGGLAAVREPGSTVIARAGSRRSSSARAIIGRRGSTSSGPERPDSTSSRIA
jgi:glyoxylase-like metal-dependent hydrolase (beta-lactamase superfamily II)